MISAKKEWLHQLMQETGSPEYGQTHEQTLERERNKSRMTNANIEGNNDMTLRTTAKKLAERKNTMPVGGDYLG